MEKVVLDVNEHINNIPKSNNINVDFIKIIKVHNQAIMEMAYMESTKGQNEKLKHRASEILARKRPENIALNRMKGRLNTDDARKDSFYRDISNQLKNKLYLPPTRTLSVDEQFAILLVSHHRTAIEMGRIFLKYSTNS